MHQQFSISTEESMRAKWPHEIFLINLVFNHIFMFCATLAVAGTFPQLMVVVPLVSFTIIFYIFFVARKVSSGDESWFIKAHWRIGAQRNRLFMLLLTASCTLCGGGFWLSKMLGWAKIPTIAIIVGVGLLPFMVSLLVLIVLGNESVFMARTGKLPEDFLEKNPDLSAAQPSKPSQT
jgi:hypothetical protein